MVSLVLALRVLVLNPEAEPAPPRFVEQLGIHLAEIAVVEPGAVVVGSTLPDKVASAAHAVDAANATLAVWIERGAPQRDDQLEYVLHIVGRREGRLLVEVLRLSAREGPDIDRALALKVGEVLDRALRDERGGAAIAEWIGGDAASDRPHSEVPRVAASFHRRWLTELDVRGGGALDAPSGQLGVAIAGGVRWQRHDLAAELVGSAGFDAGLDADGAGGERVATDEISVAIAGRLLARIDRLWLGAALAGGARFVDAEGTTPLGAVGSEWITVPTVTAGADARWPIAPALEARVAAGLEWSPDRVTLTVNEQPVVNLGRVRAVGELSLVFLIP